MEYNWVEKNNWNKKSLRYLYSILKKRNTFEKLNMVYDLYIIKTPQS